MQLTPEQKQQIENLFNSMRTNEDVSLLVNYIKSILFAEGNKIRAGKQKPIKLQTLTYLANTKLPLARYKEFSIPKKRGGIRILHAPVGVLKTIQRCLNVAFQVLAEPHLNRAATGFVPGKSIVDNARPHIGKTFVFNLDLKDFFPSIGFGRVKACLALPPFNLTDERESLAFLLANLCCERNPNDSKHSFLPQGAPTSPVLTNIVCQQLDRRLAGLAKRFRLTYTRYADDLTFSSHRNVYKPDSEFRRELSRIITEQGFVIHPSKTRLQQSGYRQEVTGIVVNDRVNVSRQYWREIKLLLYLWHKHGKVKAQECYWTKHYSNTPIKARPILANVLMGKLLYMRMVRGAEDELYKRYQNLFNSLMISNPPAAFIGSTIVSPSPLVISESREEIRFLDEVIQLWESTNSPASAAKFFYSDETHSVDNFLTELRRRLFEAGKHIILDQLMAKYLNLQVKYEKELEEEKVNKASHNPLIAKRILASFSSDETLKFFTHHFDSAVSEFNYQDFIKRASESFARLITRQKDHLHDETYYRLLGFVKGTFFKTYGYIISMAWATPALVEWCVQHPGYYPSGYLLSNEEKFPVKKNRKIKYAYFSEVIKRFKFDIQLRTDDVWQTFDKLIEGVFNETGLSTDFVLSIDRSSFGSVDTFIDTVQLKIALKQIFGWIGIHKGRSTHIKIDLVDEPDAYELNIVHVGSYASWDVNTQKWNGLSGDIYEMRKTLRNVCDWQMHVSTQEGGRFIFPYLTKDASIIKAVDPTLNANWDGEKNVTQKLIIYK